MIALYRARLAVIAAVVVAAVLIATQLPFGELLHQRSQLSALSVESSGLVARNDALRGEIVTLKDEADVASIAHAEYGLVKPGQVSYAILPSVGSSQGAPGLALAPIPSVDVVATGTDNPSALSPVAHSAGFLGRFVAHLEFWRWAL